MKNKEAKYPNSFINFVFILGAIIGLTIGLLIAVEVNTYWEKDAIANNKAQHNPTTGKVEWK